MKKVIFGLGLMAIGLWIIHQTFSSVIALIMASSSTLLGVLYFLSFVIGLLLFITGLFVGVSGVKEKEPTKDLF